jgi:hypothetical protein
MSRARNRLCQAFVRFVLAGSVFASHLVDGCAGEFRVLDSRGRRRRSRTPCRDTDLSAAGDREALALPFHAAHVVVELDDLLEEPAKDACLAPCLESRMARRSRAELRRQCLPLRAGPQAVHDSGQNRAAWNRRPPAPRSDRGPRKQRLDLVPQLIRDLRELGLHSPR